MYFKIIYEYDFSTSGVCFSREPKSDDEKNVRIREILGSCKRVE